MILSFLALGRVPCRAHTPNSFLTPMSSNSLGRLTLSLFLLTLSIPHHSLSPIHTLSPSVKTSAAVHCTTVTRCLLRQTPQQIWNHNRPPSRISLCPSCPPIFSVFTARGLSFSPNSLCTEALCNHVKSRNPFDFSF